MGDLAGLDFRLLGLCFAALFAGFVDSVAGGGGLVQLPSLMLAFPSLPIPVLFGTNKCVSLAGTTSALIRYAALVPISWARIVPCGVIAFAGSYWGATVVSRLNREYVRPVVLILLVGVALHTFLRRDFGSVRKLPVTRFGGAILLGAVGSALLGFYDGFFGPGMGSFLIFMLVAIFGLDLLHASAEAKVINFATNLAAVIYFASLDAIRFDIALPMAGCNVAGALLGTRVAVRGGVGFVRKLFVGVVVAVIIRLAYDIGRL